MSVPSTSTCPSSGDSRPARMRSSVVLPQPLGPSRLKNAPDGDLEVNDVECGDGTEPLGDAADLDRAAGAGVGRSQPARWSRTCSLSFSTPTQPQPGPDRLKIGAAAPSAIQGIAIRSVATALIDGSMLRCSFE